MLKKFHGKGGVSGRSTAACGRVAKPSAAGLGDAMTAGSGGDRREAYMRRYAGAANLCKFLMGPSLDCLPDLASLSP